MKYEVKEKMKDIYWYLNSPKIHNPEIPKHIKSVLFICKGNICRSPFTENAARKIVLERSMGEMIFSSAGLEVPRPLASPMEAITVAKTFDVDLHAHRSNGIAIYSAESYDMIIGMEAWHVHCLREMIPKLQGKIFLLPLFEKNRKRRFFSYHGSNIADPYGKPWSHYYECFKRIERCLEDLLAQIHEIVEK
jgi:protein-tyrosine phosphatase